MHSGGLRTVIIFTRGNPRDLHRVGHNVGWALLAFRTLWHSWTCLFVNNLGDVPATYQDYISIA